MPGDQGRNPFGIGLEAEPSGQPAWLCLRGRVPFAAPDLWPNPIENPQPFVDLSRRRWN